MIEGLRRRRRRAGQRRMRPRMMKLWMKMQLPESWEPMLV